MGTLHRLPTRKPEVFDPPPTGYCIECGAEMRWPIAGAWPETCPTGCTPLCLTSWPPEPSITAIVDGTGNVVGVIEP